MALDFAGQIHYNVARICHVFSAGSTKYPEASRKFYTILAAGDYLDERGVHGFGGQAIVSAFLNAL